jgi:hypothetical protein
VTDPYTPPSAPTRDRFHMPFKFKYLDDEGNETGFFSKKGSFDGETLVLDDVPIVVEAILRAQRRFNRVILAVLQEGGGVAPIALAVTKGSAGQLAQEINRESSVRWAKMRREALEEEGLGDTYRQETCPYCEAVVVVSGFPRTRQLHCEYCDSVATLGEQRPRGEDSLRLCDECGYYACPQGFTTFYFYFLLVVYGFSQSKRYMCHSCMRGEAWKMFLINFIFVLGVPVAIVQLVRAYQGGRFSSPDFPGLDAANAAAKAGKFDRSGPAYEAICSKLSAAAGVRFNQGMSLLVAGQPAAAEPLLEAALADCSNYQPAAEALMGVYERLRKTERLAALEQQWGVGQEG